MQGLRAVLWPSGCRWEPARDGFVWSLGDGVLVGVHRAPPGYLLLQLLLPVPLCLCAWWWLMPPPPIPGPVPWELGLELLLAPSPAVMSQGTFK